MYNNNGNTPMVLMNNVRHNYDLLKDVIVNPNTGMIDTSPMRFKLLNGEFIYIDWTTDNNYKKDSKAFHTGWWNPTTRSIQVSMLKGAHTRANSLFKENGDDPLLTLNPNGPFRDQAPIPLLDKNNNVILLDASYINPEDYDMLLDMYSVNGFKVSKTLEQNQNNNINSSIMRNNMRKVLKMYLWVFLTRLKAAILYEKGIEFDKLFDRIYNRCIPIGVEEYNFVNTLIVNNIEDWYNTRNIILDKLKGIDANRAYDLYNRLNSEYDNIRNDANMEIYDLGIGFGMLYRIDNRLHYYGVLNDNVNRMYRIMKGELNNVLQQHEQSNWYGKPNWNYGE